MISERDIILCGHGSGTPRTIRMDTYLSNRYKQTVTKNGKTWHKGVVAVVRPKKITEALRKAYVEMYSTIIGRNLYSQLKRKYCYKKHPDGKYYSDCSSSQTLTMAAIGMEMPAYNTEEMYHSSLFEKVPVKIKDGHIQNPEILKVADQLLFAGSDPSRDLCIGHVEGVYKIGGSGSGKEENTIADYQEWLNDHYLFEVVIGSGAKLTVDGEYGKKTRSAAVAVLKHMLNKYYGANLTIGSPYFYEQTKKAAEAVTLNEVKRHGTLAALLQGQLAAAGCYNKAITATVTSDTLSALKAFKTSKKIGSDTKLSGDVWQILFKEV